MGWVESGRAWGERAADWAYLIEPYARGANDALFDRTGVGPGTELLDIACGSGYAASVAACRGATVSGLDASEAMIAIARARTPAGDLRVGDMFALPFDDDHFNVATSFNGIWKGCEAALIEARRVVRPGGLVGFTFWGPPGRRPDADPAGPCPGLSAHRLPVRRDREIQRVLMAHVAGGGIKRQDRTVFLHTGGLPGLFGHPDFHA